MNMRKLILVAFVLSGATALIYEIAWIRPLQYILGSTTYTVSTIFSAFMAGLGLGSWLSSRFADRIKNLPSAYALMQIGIGLYGVLLLAIFNMIPDAYRAVFPLHTDFISFSIAEFMLCFLTLLIPTTLMGATWPVIAKFYTEKNVGKGIGEIYSANNTGAILGCLLGGLLLIPAVGVRYSVIFAASINLFVGSLILFESSRQLAKKVIPTALIAFLLLSHFCDYNVKTLYVGGSFRAGLPKDIVEQGIEILHHKEGAYATVDVARERAGKAENIALLMNGKGQGGTSLEDKRTNLLLSYLPVLLNKNASKALVIGFGTGTTAGHLALLTNVTIVEIEPAVLETTRYFRDVNLDVLNKSNQRVIIEDGRNYLLRSKEKYDIIVPEPCDPWQSFSAALYTKEFFELVKEHLEEDGIYVQWVPVYELTPEDFRSFYRTIHSVFPNLIAFATLKKDEKLPFDVVTTEIIIVASKKELKDWKKDLIFNFLSLPSESRKHLSENWIDSPDDLLRLYLFNSSRMRGYGEDAPLITDDFPALEFSTARNYLTSNPAAVIEDIEKFMGEKHEE